MTAHSRDGGSHMVKAMLVVGTITQNTIADQSHLPTAPSTPSLSTTFRSAISMNALLISVTPMTICFARHIQRSNLSRRRPRITALDGRSRCCSTSRAMRNTGTMPAATLAVADEKCMTESVWATSAVSRSPQREEES